MTYNDHMQIVVGQLLTNYQRQGKGKTIVVLHGWADSAAGVRALCGDLSQSYDVIAVDLPGFGGTATPQTAWGLDDYTTFIEQFLAKLGVKKVLAFVGHSNGGAMAIRGLATGALHADKLVLLASAGIRNAQSVRNRILKGIAKTGKVLTAPLPASAKKKLRSKLYAAAGSDMLVAEHMQETFKRVVGQDVQGDATALHLPTLLIYGQNDIATPPAFGELLHEHIQGSQLTILPDAGHFIHLDKPQAVGPAIKEFLQ